MTHIGRFEPSQLGQASNGNAGPARHDGASADGGPRGSIVYPWGRRIAATRLNSVGMGVLLQYLRLRAANAPPLPWSAKPRANDWPLGRG